MYEPGFAPAWPMVSAWGPDGWADYALVGSDPTSATWESAARAAYFAVVLTSAHVVRRVWWANGATTTGGATIEVGIYADAGYGPGAKLVSGSATQGTASQVQFVDVTDTTLPPGLYWLAIVSSSATNTTIFRSALVFDAQIRFQEASASPLPASATPVESASTNGYLCGFATTASP